MPVSPGTRLGAYDILGSLGAGGMGEVYRARDTRLHRDVAIKILPEAFAHDPDRMARFAREAQVLAALNHPNIAAVYGLEESDGVRALVMELVEGPTLADRIEKGPVLLEEALGIARQIAEAVEYAHEKGVVHRDLKPANVKVTPEGVVKVLDFGLAKAVDESTTSTTAGNADISPTLTLAATNAGVILGTAAYMSPEQAHGRPADKRADIWSFGVVLYEMLAGKQAFHGESISDTLAAVLKLDPDWSALPQKTPPPIRKLLARCLTKDRKQRLQAIGEARIAIETFLANPAEATAPAPPGRSVWPWAIATAAALAVAAAALTGWWMATRPVLRPLARLNVDLEDSIANSLGTTIALSSDGTRLLFLSVDLDGRIRIRLRLLDTAKPVTLTGTEGASNPFFSPDGQWVAFFADGKLKKVAVQGGAPITLCDAPSPRGGSWGEDGNIVFTPEMPGGLARVRDSGGAPQPVTAIDTRTGEITHRNPQVLPGAQAVLFVAGKSRGNYEGANIDVQSFQTGQRKTLVQGGYYGRYLSSGHLLYMHQGTLYAVPMDLKRLELAGSPAPMLDDVRSNPGTDNADFDFSSSGTLVYVSGTSSLFVRPIFWLDAAGKTQPLVAKPGVYSMPRSSPDGARLALVVVDGPANNVWVYEWSRDRLTRLTFLKSAAYPVWAPDAKHLVFSTNDTQMSGPGIYWIRADGAGGAQRLVGGDNLRSSSFSADGKRLAYIAGASVIKTMPIDASDSEHPKAGKPEMFLTGSVDPALSPDGRWMAYASEGESARMEVYVRPFPGPGGKWLVSSEGGRYPAWSHSGRELFYRALDGHHGDGMCRKGRFVCRRPAAHLVGKAGSRLFFQFILAIHSDAGRQAHCGDSERWGIGRGEAADAHGVSAQFLRRATAARTGPVSDGSRADAGVRPTLELSSSTARSARHRRRSRSA